MDDQIFVSGNGGMRGSEGACAEGICGSRCFCTPMATWEGIHTASFSPHTNLPIVHLLLPVRCWPRLLQLSSLAFSDVSFNFRHPPISSPSSLRPCTCSTSSISSSDSGSCSGFRTLPRTPPTSDELLRSQSSHHADRHFRAQWWAANVPVQ